MKKKRGFTLIEISIVLVIIGLLVGGVLVGRDMIESAAYRNALGQLDAYNQAALAFRVKYNGYPGDLPNANRFGWPLAQGTGGLGGTPANILGNKQINSCMDDTKSVAAYPPYGFIAFGCENSMFWMELSSADLITEEFTQTSNATVFPGIPASQKDLYLPQSKIKDNSIMVYSWGGKNYFHLFGVTFSISNNNGSLQIKHSLTPLQSSMLDRKIDDDKPTTGTIKAFDTLDGHSNLRLGLEAGSATTCRDASNNYNISNAVTHNPLCTLQFKAGF